MIKEVPQKGGVYRYNQAGALERVNGTVPQFLTTPCASKADLHKLKAAHAKTEETANG